MNTFISELVLQFMSLQVKEAHAWESAQQMSSYDNTVLCNVCTDVQQKAVTSCLECFTSYCGVHLEPHQRVPGLKRHTLVSPLPNLENRICKEHTRLLVFFCESDKALLCEVCATSQHLSHNIVPVPRAYLEMKGQLGDIESKAQQMIHERVQKAQAVKELMIKSAAETKDAITNNVREFTSLISDILKTQAELVKVMEERQKVAEEKAAEFISCVEMEIAKLGETKVKLEKLKQTNDHHSFLQKFRNSSILPHTIDLSTEPYVFNSQVEIQHIQTSVSMSVSQLRVLLSKMEAEIKQLCDGTDASSDVTLSYVKRYAQNVVLDLETAHPLLILSSDRKQVRYSMGSGLWGKQNNNPKKFTEHLAVLGERGFSSERFYFEVFVGGKSEWCLGVATGSIVRNVSLCRGPHCGLWALWFLVDRFETFSNPNVAVHVGKVETVGVFVDYDRGQVSFYDVRTATLIYSFTECFFLEELYPYFNPCDNEYGSNLEPLIIVPVGFTDEARETRFLGDLFQHN